MSGERVRPRVAVSSCLLGAAVRFNGGHSRDRFLSDALSDHVDWVPMCPEMDLGLGTPRETLRLERWTIGRNVNVLQHCLGMISDHLDPARRADLVEVIRSYQARHVPLSVPLALLRHHIRGAGATYLRDQTYFFPYPDELRLRNHVPA